MGVDCGQNYQGLYVGKVLIFFENYSCYIFSVFDILIRHPFLLPFSSLVLLGIYSIFYRGITHVIRFAVGIWNFLFSSEI